MNPIQYLEKKVSLPSRSKTAMERFDLLGAKNIMVICQDRLTLDQGNIAVNILEMVGLIDKDPG